MSKLLEIASKVILELYNADKVAFVSLCLTLLFGSLSWLSQRKRDKQDAIRQKEQDDFKRRAQNELRNFQEFQQKFSEYQQKINELQFGIENQSDLIPYFHINHNKSNIYYDTNNKLVIKLYLTNIGRGTAANIFIIPMRDLEPNTPVYFEADPLLSLELTHGVYDYFSEYFAIPNEDVNIEISEINNSDKQLYFLRFKIHFSDVIGREYEQCFRFGYDNYIVKGINKNSTSFPPKLIKDIN
ncbi:MAG TPA: hypothetical protein DDY64_04995 [Streptococcus sp.]|uniref:hypothetical protein n=1 Tax=Streptococcus anginosus TaxID=1328 RepID=UPI000E970942|nr:hypothetical protein [Streptococcus anginosus]HBJ54154.1 hypothetical protein [Streptococcus sp.]